MPQQQIVPTWLAWNNCNFPTQSGIQDLRTGQDFPAGGLNRGDYFDATEQEANSASALTIGMLHWGRYRLVQVDSGATAANVKTGTVGYMRAGTSVQGAVISNAGSGTAVPGGYTVALPAGVAGGSGCVLSITIGAANTVTNVSVLQGGQGYIGPSASLQWTVVGITNLTGAIIALELYASPNVVTSFDIATTFNTLTRPVVFLNSITPGQYGFVQELGLATVLSNATVGTANPGDYVNAVAAGAGTVTTTAASGSPVGSTLAVAMDKPIASQLYKAVMQYVPVVQD